MGRSAAAARSRLAGRELASEHLLTAIPEIRSWSKTDPESVAEVTKWLDSHTRSVMSKAQYSRPAATRSCGA